jgi:hypothetical protein
MCLLWGKNFVYISQKTTFFRICFSFHFQCLRLALSSGTNRVVRVSVRLQVVSYLKYGAVVKVRTLSASECYTPSSEPLRFRLDDVSTIASAAQAGPSALIVYIDVHSTEMYCSVWRYSRWPLRSTCAPLVSVRIVMFMFSVAVQSLALETHVCASRQCPHCHVMFMFSVAVQSLAPKIHVCASRQRPHCHVYVQCGGTVVGPRDPRVRLSSVSALSSYFYM